MPETPTISIATYPEGLDRRKAVAERFTQRSEQLTQRLLELEKASNLTRKALAERLGVSPTQISRWFQPGENLTLHTIVRLEEAFGQPILSFLSGTSDNQQA